MSDSEPVVLSARSPRIPHLYDPESGVHFSHGVAEVTEEQAEILANRPFMQGILIGTFDDDGRPVDEQPAKDWRKAKRRAEGKPDTEGSTEDGSDDAGESGSGEQTTNTEPPAEATTVAKKTPRSK